ncbi:MAG: hypothetical protein NZX77_04540 [Polyangiaceae bacterium]|nr:hypothetical protein [Polyangiaceae bacterium]
MAIGSRSGRLASASVPAQAPASTPTLSSAHKYLAAAPSASPAAPATFFTKIPVEPLRQASRAELARVNLERPPLESEDLTGQARRLFEAIQGNEPSKASDFFFPKEPFLVLKDIKSPGKYWDQLYRVYEEDIRKLHRKYRKDLEGATFEGFALGSIPTLVKPGEEGNKISYHRTFRGKLCYRTAQGKERFFEVRVMISWAGRWYITHLLPFKRS